MRLLRLCSCFLCFVCAILIIAGCGGISSSSNPASPPGGGSGGGSGGGGGNPPSNTFIYVASNTSGETRSTEAFRFNSDGSTAPVPGSPFTDPQQVYAQSGKFLVGHSSSNFSIALYAVDQNTGVPQSAVSISNANSRAVIADAANVYGGGHLHDFFGDGIDALSVADGKLTPVPGSPFGIAGNTLLPFFMTRSLLFSGRNSQQDGDLTVFSRSSTGALTRFASVGPARSFYLAAIHPSARFIYKLDLGDSSDTINVFSFNPDTGASGQVQQLSFQNDVRVLTVDVLGRYLYVPEKGIRVFSIDQNSGKLTEVAGSPFFNGDATIRGVVPDPTGRFLLVIHGNTFETVAIDAATGKLTLVATAVTISGQEIGAIAFATF